MTAIFKPLFEEIWESVEVKISFPDICISHCIPKGTILAIDTDECEPGWTRFTIDEEQNLLFRDKGIIFCIKK